MTVFEQTGASYTDPVGCEIGGLIASLVQGVIDAQSASIGFSIQGIEGTHPVQVVTEDTKKVGTGTVKSFIDAYTKIPYDDSVYPDVPLLYEYMQREIYFIWRKQKALTSNPVMRLTIGKDAILHGTIQYKPLYTDAIATGKTTGAYWTLSDRDASIRWGNRRFTANLSSSSSYLSDCYSDTVRTLELYKLERKSFQLVVARDAYTLFPGDIIAVDGGEALGIRSENYRVSEVSISLSPTLRTVLTLGDPQKLLTDYLV